MLEDFEERFKTAYDVRSSSLYRHINEQQNLLNPYADAFSFDFYVFVSENATGFQSERELIWAEKNLTYGPESSFRELRTRLDTSEVSKVSAIYRDDLTILPSSRMCRTTAVSTCTSTWSRAVSCPAHLGKAKWMRITVASPVPLKTKLFIAWGGWICTRDRGVSVSVMSFIRTGTLILQSTWCIIRTALIIPDSMIFTLSTLIRSFSTINCKCHLLT